MSLVGLDGGFLVPIGPSFFGFATTTPSVGAIATLDAANEAAIMIGQVIWSDGGSHTIDTTGSSLFSWRSGTTTFANAGTTVKVGLGAIDAANGPPGRATNVADVITFDVAAVLVGGGGGIPNNAAATSAPTTGTKTIANGDMVAFSVQMTARAGADSVIVNGSSLGAPTNRPFVTQFTGGVYAAVSVAPLVVITASDGTIGWFYGTMPSGSVPTRTFSSGGAGATKEYGQLYKLPFPCKVYGIYGDIAPTADLDWVLYSDPLGTPVAQRTVAMDLNVVNAAVGRTAAMMFSSPYTLEAEQLIVAAYKPGASNITVRYRTLHSATHRVMDVGGVDGYGVNRDAGAFADDNSGLNHYFIGLLVGGFSYNAARLVNGGLVR
jgi:hypothetical protein